jgi:hypothetical protein
VANQGTNAETFDVTLTDTTPDPDVVIDTKTVTALAAGTSNNVLFSWGIDGASLGDHVLEANAVLTADEDTSNNTGTATVTLTDGSNAVYHVATMTLFSDRRGPWHRLTATITIADADDTTVGEGLTVTGSISREGRTFLYSQTTDGSGQVQFKLRTQLTETLYTVAVTDVDDNAGGAFDSSFSATSKTICFHAGGPPTATCD